MKQKIKLKGRSRYWAPLAIVVVVAAIGAYILIASHASTSLSATSEAENGTLSGTTSKIADSGASGGNAVKFGTAATNNNPGTSGGCTSGGTIAPCIGNATTGASGWSLKFDDEFSGTSLDRTKWGTDWFSGGARYGNDPNNNGCTDSNNLTVTNGELDLVDKSESVSCGAGSYGTAGAIATTNPGSANPGFQYTYGYAEARIWVPGGSNYTNGSPSFWTDGQNWPSTGEIDMLETLDGDGSACMHWHGPNSGSGPLAAGYGITTYKAGQPTNGCFFNTTDGVNGDGSGQWAGQWHTYASDWESGIVKFYYDGKYDGCISSYGTGCGAPDSGWASAYITNSPMYLILGIGTGSGLPATQRVDYVRVWQH